MEEMISTEKELPHTWRQVLTHGRTFGYAVGCLTDCNGEDGFRRHYSMLFGETKIPNLEYPNNLSWTVQGHPIDFKDVTHWAELPQIPK
jgi:hypothetical protein